MSTLNVSEDPVTYTQSSNTQSIYTTYPVNAMTIMPSSSNGSCHCQNEATCVSGLQNTFSCLCLAGFSGILCEISFNPCDKMNPCGPKGKCYNNNGVASCKCLPGWTGANCVIDINECLTSPCGLNEICQNSVGSYVCICPPGFRLFAPKDCRELAIMTFNAKNSIEHWFGFWFWRSSLIYLDNAFTLGGEAYTSFRISINGYLSPGTRYGWYWYFWGNIENAYNAFIAGYMGGFMLFDNHGSIKYDIVYKADTNNHIFRQKVDSIILQANPGLNYSSEMIIYVHWNNVQKWNWYYYICYYYRYYYYYYYFYYYFYLDCNNLQHERANFQVIVSSDGKNTYAIFNHDKPTWDPNSFSYYNYLSGFTDARGTYGMVPGSLSSSSKDLSNTKGNTGVYGRWVYKIGFYESPQTKCKKWISNNYVGPLTCTMCPPTFDQALSTRGVMHRVSSCSQQSNAAGSFQITFQLRTRFSTLFSPGTYSAGVCSYTVTFKNQMADRMRPYLCTSYYPEYEWYDVYYKMYALKMNIFKIQMHLRSGSTNQISGGALNRNYPSTGSLFVYGYNIIQSGGWWWWYSMKRNSWSSEEYGYNICIKEAQMYDAYNTVRPPCGTSDTYWTIRTRIALMNGDPHITTPDGRSWTFNGLGEYTLIRTKTSLNSSEAVPMIIQARTAIATSSVTNTTSKATIFSGFAAQANDTATIQILYNVTADDMDVYINGTLETNVTSLSELDTALLFAGGSIVASSNSSVQVDFEADFSMQITKTLNFLEITLSLGTTFNNATEGLLGNFNGDKTDEFIMPNGTLLADNSTERQLYVYGQTWRVTNSQDSLFTYTANAPFDSLYDLNFEPVYAEDFADPLKLLGLFDNNTQLLQEANITCLNPVESIYLACMYDVSQLKDTKAGSMVVSANKQFSESKSILKNTPPKFDMPQLIYMDMNSPSQFNLSIVDDEGNEFTVKTSEIFEANSSVASTMNISLSGDVLTVTITSALSAGFEVEAFDTFNAVGMWQPKIRLCACVNEGICSFDHLNQSLSKESSNNVYLGRCDCPDYYLGDQCEVTPCQTVPSPCYTSSSCEMASGSNFTCGPCPAGTVGDGKTCDDRNECLENSTICEDVCVNTEGSYECQCRNPGFNVSISDPSKCEDIDECQKGTSTCTGIQICTNTIGSFECLCPHGYAKDIFGDCDDVNECSTGIDYCSTGTVCVNTLGSYLCFCKPGYTLRNQTCADIDECRDSNACPSNSVCENSVGSFECICNPGYNKRGSICADIDECTSNTDDCSSKTICINTIGGFTCKPSSNNSNSIRFNGFVFTLISTMVGVLSLF